MSYLNLRPNEVVQFLDEVCFEILSLEDDEDVLFCLRSVLKEHSNQLTQDNRNVLTFLTMDQVRELHPEYKKNKFSRGLFDILIEEFTSGKIKPDWVQTQQPVDRQTLFDELIRYRDYFFKFGDEAPPPKSKEICRVRKNKMLHSIERTICQAIGLGVMHVHNYFSPKILKAKRQTFNIGVERMVTLEDIRIYCGFRSLYVTANFLLDPSARYWPIKPF